MRLFDDYLRSQARECEARGVRVTLVGRRDRLAPALRDCAEAFETRDGERGDPPSSARD